MRKPILSLLIVCLLLPVLSRATGGTWIWKNGSTSTFGANANYGTQGMPGPNVQPGSLSDAAFWIDLQGNFWLFGGSDLSGMESDLWKFDPVLGQWTWVKGPGVAVSTGVYGILDSPSVTNNPGARDAQTYSSATWVDHNGNLWLFGGYGYGNSGTAFASSLNDLWMYNISTNTWTWMNGSNTTSQPGVYGVLDTAAPNNTPGARFLTSAWVDNNGDFWLFGGTDDNLNAYNDMWRYQIATNEWTWMSGTNGPTSTNYNYGTIGSPSPTNLPPPRGVNTHWKDPQGNLYMWSGVDGPQINDYTDVWQYNTNNNEWTWIAGSDRPNFTGNYNQYCTLNGNNGPMERWDNPSPQALGCSIIGLAFGGEVESVEGTLNDVWSFNLQTNEYTWLAGTTTQNDVGSYSTIGSTSPSNDPPARQSACSWIDANGNFWIFGGSNSIGSSFNDMWEFVPVQSCVGAPLTGGISYQLSNNTTCTGDSVKISFKGLTNGSISPAPLASWIDTAHAYLFPDTTTTYLITGQSTCRSDDTSRVTVYVVSPGNFYYTVSDTQLCQGNSSYLALYGLIGATIYPTTGVIWQDSAHAILTPQNNTHYHIVSRSSVCGTPDTAAFVIHVTNYDPISVSPADTTICYGNPLDVQFTGLSNITLTPTYYATWLDSADVELNPYSNQLFEVSASTSCGSSFNSSINVNVNFPGELNYTVAPPVLCGGDSALLTFSGISSAQITPTSYVYWVGADTAWLNPPTTTTYFIAGFDAVCSVLDTQTITVYVEQPGTIAYTVDSQICSGFSAYLQIYGGFNDSLSPFAYIYAYDTFGDGEAYLYVDSTTTYTLSGTNACGQYVSEQFTVIVSNNGYFTLANPVVCRGDSDLLNLVGFVSGSVTPSNSVIQIDATDFYLVPDSNTNYVINGTTVCGGSYTQPISVAVIGAAADIFALDTSICSDDSAQICASPGLVHYQWNTGQAGQCIVTSLAGSYYCTVTDQNGCTAESNRLGISVKPAPPVIVSVNGDTLTAFNSQAYQWYFNGALIPGAVSDIYIAQQSGNYSVSTYGSNGCTATSNLVPVVAGGINDISNENGVMVYPNPTLTSWNVEVTDNWIGSDCEIYDADGRLLWKSLITGEKTLVNGEFASGIYVVKIHNSNYSYITRLVKM